MAKKTWNKPIDKYVDWGGDPVETGGLPVSGEMIQRFIKETLDKKVGEFYFDPVNNMYLVFADADEKQRYLDDPTQTHLILGNFEAPFNFSAEINLATPTYNAVFLGATGNYIDFTFDVKNKQNHSTGEGVNISYTFIRNASREIKTETRRYGESVHFNIDEYLLEGKNTVIISVTGQDSLASTSVSLTYEVVNLTLSDEMNIAKVYDLSKGPQSIEVFFTVSGTGRKTLEWFIDGAQLDFVKTEDEVVDASSSRPKYISISNLSNGTHSLQLRAYTLINGERFYTDTYYREFLVQNGGAAINAIAIATTLPHSYGIVNENNPLALMGIEQYLPYDLRFATLKSTDVSVYLGEDLLAVISSIQGKETVYSITSKKAGSLPLKFVLGDFEREISLAVESTSLNIEEINSDLVLDFSARGRINEFVGHDTWSFNDYSGTFEGFNWNNSSGWYNNSLIINNGATFSIDIAPLATDATSTGRTLEFEFSTRNVENDDAVICNLLGENGAGLLITASEARLVSAAGEVLSRRFKSGEINRIAFVINRKAGVTFKGLAFIYINGIMSGAIDFGGADNFISPATLSFTGTEGAQVELRAMRFYDTALSSENMLNNFILYRDTLNEMLSIYYRNDIYEDGTVNFSPSKAQHRLPVMIVTGEIPILEGATSTSTQIIVDIDYTNEQFPDRSFTMKNAAMRIQGTSSLAYPRKNFRIYTREIDDTIVYDADHNEIADKLYAFKEGSQAVDCWCLKADFAESSGTHNTGVARIWNDVMYNARIQHKNVLGETVDGYVLRTRAQAAAVSAGYRLDVRTTIDGFPILLFYRRNEDDSDLIFLGKYNFNNDKSTPSVFGFENIPGFDNSRMQCWETKDNGNPLGLFTDISGFDQNWSNAFESRYPDTKTPYTGDLKAFSLWVNSVSQDSFIKEKWAHLDVYKVAAYYVYLMRFGAVDQTVKNGFLTSEDGEKFFYINYDNDTVNGLINTGDLTLGPDVNRQTIGADGEYVYAGHESVLWNLCENDSEFMDIVSIVDNALFLAGLRYDNVISIFNDEQASKWVERVYNQDAEYKYLLPFVNTATNNLFMMQGSRSSHRSWWLSKRFSLYDSLFASGNYRDRNISFKCLNDTAPGQAFTITAGTAMNYGYGVNNGIRETGVALEKGKSHRFITTDTLNLGDVVKIFAAANIASVDFSELASRLSVLDCSAANDPALGSKLKTLILGKRGVTNTQLSAISGIGVLTSLQTLNIEGYKGITALDLQKQTDFRELYAKGSKLASIEFAKGAPVSYMELPATMLSISFDQLPYITWDNIVIEGSGNIESIYINDCPNLSNNFSFVRDWVASKTQFTSSNVLEMNNIKWENMDVEDFVAFSQYKANGFPMILKGNVYLNSMTLEQANMFYEIWGDDCFVENDGLRINAPDAIYINPDDITILEGESAQFDYILFSSENGTVEYRIIGSGRTGASVDRTTGLLTTTENGLADGIVYVRAIYTSESGQITYDTATVNVKKRIYPSSSSISLTGASTIGKDETYSWSSSTANVTGAMVANWTLSGTAFDEGYISIKSSSVESCIVEIHKAAEPNQSISATLSLTLAKEVDGTTVATKSMTVTIASYSYPTSSNTTISGDREIGEEGATFTWASTATGYLGAFTAEWSLSEGLAQYYEITSQEHDTALLNGSCTISPIATVENYAKGDIVLTITRTSSGESFSVTKTAFRLSGDVVMTDDTNPAVLSCLYNAGLCANSTHMTKAEAEAVSNGQFNPTGTEGGSIFYSKNNITSFNELQYFTGLTAIDAYAFYRCDKLASVKIPNTVDEFGTNCFSRRSTSGSDLHIDHINLRKANTDAFGSYGSSYNKVIIDVIDMREDSSSVNTRAFSYARINRINVYSMKDMTYNSGYHKFENAIIGEVVVDKNAILGTYGMSHSTSIDSIHIPETIDEIPYECFGSTDSLPSPNSAMQGKWTKIKFDGIIKKIGNYAFGNAWFDDFVDFSSLLSNGETNPSLFSAIHYDSGLTFEYTSRSTLKYGELLGSNHAYAKKLICSRNTTKYQLYRDTSGNREIEELYIPNMANFCNSVSSDSTCSFAAYANRIFYLNEMSDQYEELINFDTDEFAIYDVPAMLFRDCKPIKKANLLMLRTIPNYLFENSGVREISIDNCDGIGSIGTMAFKDCKDLVSINDTSYSPWKSISIDAFFGINENVTINSNVFGLFIQKTGIAVNTSFTMNSGTIYALPFGEKEFTLPAGAYFDDMTTVRKINLAKTGVVEDLTSRIMAAYMTVKISSNMPDAEFKINYINATSGEGAEAIVGVGDSILPIRLNTKIKIIPIKKEGYDCNETETTPTTGTCSVTMKFSETINIHIQHINGNLFTIEEWQNAGYSQSEANGIAFTSISSNFLVAPPQLWTYKKMGGYGVTITDLTNIGKSDSAKIIAQLSGYTDSKGTVGSPACEYCRDVSFPNGMTGGYLPGKVEWDVMSRGYATKLLPALKLLGRQGDSMNIMLTEQASSTSLYAYSINYNGSYSTSNWHTPLKDSTTYSTIPLNDLVTPIECTALTIVADDVDGRATTTIIRYTATMNSKNLVTGEIIEGTIISGTAVSESFAQNTSTENVVTRTISFTYKGQTATTTITQGVWVPSYYSINLNNGAWALSSTVPNPDSAIYDGVYQSVKSKGVNNGYDIMYIDIIGYTTFKLYIRSYAEGNYDYMMVSQLDKTITSSTSYSDSTLIKAHTRGNQKSGTAISDYTLVEFSNIDAGSHRITVVYRKDSSDNSNDDRGYVIIPKNQ